MSDFLGAKHQSSTNTSKFQWTNICLFKELFKFSFLLLCVYNNSSKSNFKFLSSPEGFQKDVFIIIIIGHSTFRILVPWARIEPTSLAVRAGTPNHWTTRKLPQKIDFNLHTVKQRKRSITSLKRLFLQKQNQKRLKTKTNLESTVLNIVSFFLSFLVVEGTPNMRYTQFLSVQYSIVNL